MSIGGVTVPVSADDDARFDALVPCARGDLILRRYDDGTLAWSPAATEPLPLEPLTDTLLGLLDGTVSAGELVVDLAAVLEADVAVARDVLRAQLWALKGAGLLTTSLSDVPSDRPCEVFPAPFDP